MPAVQRAVLHALQAAEEDLAKWCSELTDDEIQQRPAGWPRLHFICNIFLAVSIGCLPTLKDVSCQPSSFRL